MIAKGVGMFDDKTTSLVITADGELQSRCRRNAPSGGTLHIMDPAKFLDDLELAALKSGINMEEQEQEEALASSSLSLGEQIKLGQLDAEIKLRGQLLDLEIQLGKKPKMTNKRRKKLGAKINKLKENLALRGPSLLDQITSIDDSRLKTNGENGNLGIDHRQQDLLLSRWREIQNRSSRREQTGDRVVYAEQLRRQIMDNEETVMNFDLGEKDNWPPAQSFVMHMNGFMSIPENKYDSGIGPKNSILPNEIKGFVGDTDISPPAFSTYELLNTVHGTRSSSFTSNGSKIDTLKLVVVSDTHGFEGQLVDPETSSDILPEGDILLHLGDFAKEGSFEQEMNSLRAFDTWLAKQPHKYKVIVRGNHDPFICDFPLSGAWYVTKPTTILIPNDRQQEQQSFVLGVVPHGSPRNLSASKCIPSSCDILATHLPPFKTGLDRTYTGKNVGSPFLSKIVRSMGDQAPRLWFCGHIHEGRGVYKKQFSGSSSRETTIVSVFRNCRAILHFVCHVQCY